MAKEAYVATGSAVQDALEDGIADRPSGNP
jgi:hypothetical protein